MQVLVEFWF